MLEVLRKSLHSFGKPKQTTGHQPGPVSVYSEFQPLEEVIVGRAYPARAFDSVTDKEFQDSIKRVLEETEEDLSKLCEKLKELGVSVRRPEVNFELYQEPDKPYVFDLQSLQFQFPNHPLMPRDTMVAYGNKVVETYTASGGRYFENSHYYEILMDYFKHGSSWTAMPPPRIEGHNKTYLDYADSKFFFHAANLLKCGNDILYSQPSIPGTKWTGKGTPLGLEWLKRQFPDVNFHESPCQGHLDGKIALLKPGLVATWSKKFLPECLKNWDVIVVDSPNPFPDEFNNMRKRRFYKEFVVDWLSDWIGYVDETVFDINMLSVSEELVITNGYNESCYRQFKKHGIEAIPWDFRHQYFWDGAIHCVTLDVRRKGGPESYL